MKAAALLKGLRQLYPDANCELDHKTPLELLVATILSAQCTDKRVNLVTKALFKKYRSAADYAKADTAELEADIRSTGFFRSKAKSIQETAKILVAEHHGKVPDTMEELLELRGVARKTANVILGTAYGKASGIVVDTHMKRVAFRLGLTAQTDPEKVEVDLMKSVPKRDWIFFSQAMVWHGRRVCFARNPDCPGCALNRVCPRRGL
ncbi:MAG: endonuclease III [Elusimicrobia bacterium]|nr:endonuclease III [Elusimicrobiota bacterium]